MLKKPEAHVFSKYCIDRNWKKLQPVVNWFELNPLVGKQKDCYSDILKKNVRYNC